MRALIIGEMKKIFSQKFVLAVLCILLFVNIFNAYQTVVDSSDYWELKNAYDKMYALAQGEITQESVGRIISYRDKLENSVETGEKIETFLANAGTDLLHINNIIEELTDIYNYNGKITSLKDNIKLQREVLGEKNNTYLERVNDKIDSTYSQRKITHFYNSKGFAAYFDYDFSSFLVLLIVILACSSVFAGEKESGVSALISGTVNGRTKLSFSKKLSCVFFIAAVSIIFFISDFAVFYFATGMRGLSLPLYALKGYEYTPLTMSIGVFMFVTAIIKILGFIYIGMIVCAFSSFINKSYAVFGAGLAGTFILMYISSYSNEKTAFFNLINPINLLTNRNMFNSFSVTNILNYPFNKYTVTLIFSLAAIFAVSIIITVLNSKGQKGRNKR